MTKEECLQALKDFTHEVLRDYNNIKFDRKSNKHVLKSRFQRQHDLLEQLIHEHFDNPPLSFDDLHEGMWVWDNKEKQYEKIHNTKLAPHVQFRCSEVKVLHVVDIGWCITFFRENRFYRRQKED